MTSSYLLVTASPKKRNTIHSARSTRATRGGQPWRRSPALIPYSPCPPALISAGAKSALLAAAGVEITVCSSQPPACAHLALCLPSTPWLGRNSPTRGSRRPGWNSHMHLHLHLHSVETCCGLLHRTYRGLLQGSGELRATGELYTGELHNSHTDELPFSQVTKKNCVEMLQAYISSASDVSEVCCNCCKNNSGYCTCCNSYTRMLQTCVPNVLHYYSNFYGGEQKTFTEAGRPTASDQRSRLIVA
jgi:hypothetical protein